MRRRVVIFLTATAATALISFRPGLAQASPPAHPSRASSALHDAVVAAQQGESVKALALTQQLLVKYPSYAPAFKFEGALLEDAGKTAEAEVRYEQALKLTPNDPELLYKIGVNRLLRTDYDDSISLLREAAKLRPRDGDTLFYLAQAYHLHGENDLALKTIAQSARLEPDNAAVLQKYGELLSSAGNNAGAVEWLRRAQKLDPTLDWLNFDLGLASFRNQELEAAAEYAGKAVEARSSDVRALQLLAQIDVKLARWQQARSLYTRILAVQPEDATSLLELGHTELGLKNYQAAVDALQRVLQQQPATIAAHFYLSRAYAGLGREDDAAHETEVHNQLVERAGSIVPEDEKTAEAKTFREARRMLSDGLEPQALQLFRAHSKGPTSTPGAPFMLVGVSYLYMGRLKDAERCLKRAIETEPTVHLAHTYLGMLALQEQKIAEAERQFDMELKQDSSSQLAVAELGEVRYRQGRWSEAADHLWRSRTIEPRLLYLLSDSYFHLGNVKDANLTAELAADYAKNDPAMLEQLADLLTKNHQVDFTTRLTAK